MSIPSILTHSNQWESPFQAGENQLAQLASIDEKIEKIKERHIWNNTHLVPIAYERTYLFCLYDIYFSQKNASLSSSKESIASLIDQRHTQKIQKIFEETFQCIRGMYAADIASLDLSFMPSGEKLDDLGPPLFCKRPTSGDDKTRAWELYKTLANRSVETVMYGLEHYLQVAAKSQQGKQINVSDLVHDVIGEKVNQILGQVLANRAKAA